MRCWYRYVSRLILQTKKNLRCIHCRYFLVNLPPPSLYTVLFTTGISTSPDTVLYTIATFQSTNPHHPSHCSIHYGYIPVNQPPPPLTLFYTLWLHSSQPTPTTPHTVLYTIATFQSTNPHHPSHCSIHYSYIPVNQPPPPLTLFYTLWLHSSQPTPTTPHTVLYTIATFQSTNPHHPSHCSIHYSYIPVNQPLPPLTLFYKL